MTHLVADHTVSTITTSTVAVWLIQQLKKAKWFPIVQERGTVFAARLLSVLAAVAGTAGIQWQWAPSTGTLAITGLTWTVVGIGAWHCVQHFALQEWIYQSAVNKPSPQAVLDALREKVSTALEPETAQPPVKPAP